jgi:hypothetical protein
VKSDTERNGRESLIKCIFQENGEKVHFLWMLQSWKLFREKTGRFFPTNFVCGVDKIKNELRQDGTNEIFLAAGRSSALEYSKTRHL